MRMLVAVVVSALLTIASGPLQMPWLAFVFKPLTTILILVHAWPRGADESRVRHWLLVGLALSLGGDVALLWPQQGFLPGLIAFLLAHLSYIVAFSLRVRFAARWQPFALYAAVSLVILSQLWPGVSPALRVPVLAYVVCLATMAAQAAAAWLAARGSEREGPWRSAAIGGALFVASDALLATNKFVAPLPLAALGILATYWAAQWCIAASLRR